MPQQMGVLTECALGMPLAGMYFWPVHGGQGLQVPIILLLLLRPVVLMLQPIQPL